MPEDESRFIVRVNVHLSKPFFWRDFSPGESVKRVGPENVAAQINRETGRLIR